MLSYINYCYHSLYSCCSFLCSFHFRFRVLSASVSGFAGRLSSLPVADWSISRTKKIAHENRKKIVFTKYYKLFFILSSWTVQCLRVHDVWRKPCPERRAFGRAKGSSPAEFQWLGLP